MAIARRKAEPVNDEAFAPESEDNQDERSSSITRRGWGAAQSAIDNAKSNYADDFRITEESQLIKFLEPEPYWAGATHWVDEIREGKRSFYCLGAQCPMCAIGHKPRAVVKFNVSPIGEGEPQVLSLDAGPLLARLIKTEHDDRSGPIDRHYWRVSKTGTGGKGGKVQYRLVPVKERDLAEEYELDPITVKASLADLKLYDEDIVQMPSVAELQNVVVEHLSED